MNKFKAWYNIAYRVWIPLSLGWSTIIIGITPYLCLDRAGAFLVCGAIVAGVFNDKRHRLFVYQIQPGHNTSQLYKEVNVPNAGRKDIEVSAQQWSVGRRIINTDQWSLYHLAKSNEFIAFEDTRAWILEGTMMRVERTIDFIIVFTAVVGTVLSAFG